MSYFSLEKHIALSKTKPEILQACQAWNCKTINSVIHDLMEHASSLRQQAYELTHKANILGDEVGRRAEQMECRIVATTDDDHK